MFLALTLEEASLGGLAIISTVVPAAALVVGILTYRLNRISSRNEQAWRRSEDTFNRVRHKMKTDMAELQHLAQAAQPQHFLVPQVPLLVRPGWIPSRPLSLREVRLRWKGLIEDEETARRRLDPARYQTLRYWPRFHELRDSYHEVIRRLESPNPDLFFDGSSFRLLDVEPESDGELVLTFGPGRYFDHLDTTDVLALRNGVTGSEREWDHAGPA